MSLNLISAIGLLVSGILFVLVYDDLAKKWLGWLYFITIMSLAMAAYYFEERFIAALALAIYILAWIHANLILSNYQSAARRRVSELEKLKSPDIDAILEKAFLCQQVLKEEPVSHDIFSKALELPGGDSRLLTMAGGVMSLAEQSTEAAQYFDRAYSNAKDETEIQYINKMQAAISKFKDIMKD